MKLSTLQQDLRNHRDAAVGTILNTAITALVSQGRLIESQELDADDVVMIIRQLREDLQNPNTLLLGSCKGNPGEDALRFMENLIQHLQSL
jgi:hypothetical protein